MPQRKKIIFDDNEEGETYIATFIKKSSDIDDDFESDDSVEIMLTASDFNTAVRYAQQYLRKMKSDEESKDEWVSAELVSVELY